MFTGIIESVGTVSSFRVRSPKSYELVLDAKFSNLQKDPIQLGESIAVNGTCLTVTHIDPLGEPTGGVRLSFDLAPETVRATSLEVALARPSKKVNLERAMKLGDRLSGHWVQGHVDSTAVLVSTHPVADGCYEMVFELKDPHLARYCIKKGSITLDGISLTLHEVQQNRLTVQIIPHTWTETNLSDLGLGEQVNCEVDCLAKYIENLMKDRV